MRYQWRILLFRSIYSSHRPFLSHYSQFKASSNPTRSFSSVLHDRCGVGALQQIQRLLALRPPLMSYVGRSFSSEPAKQAVVVIDVFSRLNGKDEIKKALDSNDIVISHELAVKVLRAPESRPDVAVRFFQWVLEVYPSKLSSESYNTLLLILGVNGHVDGFWRLAEAMKKKGHGVSANVRDKVGEKFQRDGLEGDLKRLKELFDTEDSLSHRVCKIVRKNKWSANVQKQLKDLQLEFKSNMVKLILERLSDAPGKALLFFRWVDESGSFKHDDKTYNAMAMVLGRKTSLASFQLIFKEIKSAGYELETVTFERVFSIFCQLNMIEEAVELFEFAMAGSNKPTQLFPNFLLKVVRQLDMDLFSRTVKAYTGNGYVLSPNMEKLVLHSLKQVEQRREVMKAMYEGKKYEGSELVDLENLLGLRKPKEEDTISAGDKMDAVFARKSKTVDAKAAGIKASMIPTSSCKRIPCLDHGKLVVTKLIR